MPPSSQQKLTDVIMSGCTVQVSEYLARGIHPNKNHACGLTPLALAWQNNDWLCAELLLSYGARINETMSLDGMGEGNTLLHLVCSTRGADASWISFLGDHGALPDAENSLGLTPMYYATCLFSAHKISELVSIGACGSRIYRQRPVLHMAAVKHSARLVTAIVDAGTSIDCRDEDGRTVLHYANQFRSYRILNEVFALGANPNAQDKWGNTPLHTVVSSLGEHFLHPCFLELFLTAGARINTCNRDGETVLHKLPWSKPARASLWLEKLLEAGADVTRGDPRGMTPLMMAEQTSDKSLISMLVTAGATPSHVFPDRRTNRKDTASVTAAPDRQGYGVSP